MQRSCIQPFPNHAMNAATLHASKNWISAILLRKIRRMTPGRSYATEFMLFYPGSLS